MQAIEQDKLAINFLKLGVYSFVRSFDWCLTARSTQLGHIVPCCKGRKLPQEVEDNKRETMHTF